MGSRSHQWQSEKCTHDEQEVTASDFTRYRSGGAEKQAASVARRITRKFTRHRNLGGDDRADKVRSRLRQAQKLKPP